MFTGGPQKFPGFPNGLPAQNLRATPGNLSRSSILNPPAALPRPAPFSPPCPLLPALPPSPLLLPCLCHGSTTTTTSTSPSWPPRPPRPAAAARPRLLPGPRPLLLAAALRPAQRLFGGKLSGSGGRLALLARLPQGLHLALDPIDLRRRALLDPLRSRPQRLKRLRCPGGRSGPVGHFRPFPNGLLARFRIFCTP